MNTLPIRIINGQFKLIYDALHDYGQKTWSETARKDVLKTELVRWGIAGHTIEELKEFAATGNKRSK